MASSKALVAVGPRANLRQVDEAKRGLYNAEAKIEQYGKETGKDLQKKIDETDKKIEQKAAQTKSSISSFFSSGNK